jgi:hypothetical protein
MREFMNLLEGAETVTLYRGDNQDIEKFEVEKTDHEALFGTGIYLTDHPEVAGDYTVKGKEGVFFSATTNSNRDGAKSPRDLTTALLRKLMDDAGFEQQQADLKDDWQSKFYQEMPHDVDADERKMYQDKFTLAFQTERSKLVRKVVAKAKAQFKEMRHNLRIKKLTTGEYVFTNVGRTATVAKFEVPTAYLSKCLHAEQPLPDAALKIVRALYFSAAKSMGHGPGDETQTFDLRVNQPTGHETQGHTFDSFVTGYKKNGSRYAWSDRSMGGAGENPSLDLFWNGTHSGYWVFKDTGRQKELVKALQGLGYVGLAYDGGTRIVSDAAANRGGGGVLHRAYVMWDAHAINSMRVGSDAPGDEEFGPLENGIRAKALANR